MICFEVINCCMMEIARCKGRTQKVTLRLQTSKAKLPVIKSHLLNLN